MSSKKLIQWVLAAAVVVGTLAILRGHPLDSTAVPKKVAVKDPVIIKGRPIHYHEVLVGYRSWLNYSVVIYNDLNNVIPDKDFFALDKEKIKEELNADIVILNGPRYWVLDEIEATKIAPRRMLGGFQWSIPGAVEISLLDIANRKPFRVMAVNRDTIYRYYKGSKVYQIVNDKGEVFTMQAFSQIVDKNQTIESLDSLSQRIKLPEGWSYRVVTLEKELVLNSGGQAYILQDDLQNTYQRTSISQSYVEN